LHSGENQSLKYVTQVRLRPNPTGILPIVREPGIYEMEWSRLSKQIQLIGGKIQTMLNVLGNDYDLMIIGEAEDPKALPRIDALCKREGFEAKTHLAVAAEEYAKLVHEISRTIHRGGVLREQSDGERQQA
jgi:uncharacterized protein with GYD domain